MIPPPPDDQSEAPRRPTGRRRPAPPRAARLARRAPAVARLVLSLLVTALAAGGCSDDEADPSPIVYDITLSEVRPGQVLPGTRLELLGVSFLPDVVGPTTFRFSGTFGGAEVALALPAQFVDYDKMVVEWPGGMAAGLPSDEGTLVGQAHVEIPSAFDGLVHQSPPLPVVLDVRYVLTPRLDSAQYDGTFVNDPIVLYGDGFLLGGLEGESVAIVEGCYTLEGSASCDPIVPAEIRADPAEPYNRARLTFPFSPHIAGILPGSFTGTVRVENRHGPLGSAQILGTEALVIAKLIVEPIIFSLAPSSASLGQYVDAAGGGYVGVPTGEPGTGTTELTTIELDGSFTRVGEPDSTPVSLSLIPEFFHGQLVRYVVNEEDSLGQSLDLWRESGTFVGTARPVVRFGTDTVQGSDTPVTLELGYVKQVIWLRLQPAYVESLRHFGLRAADLLIRQRIFEVVRRDYLALNVEWRDEEPTDFALYSKVDIAGRDPNGMGLMGYDNTPGKDDGNRRLYDKIGGVNALTQEDGYPGYGGVFVESLFLFSQHPGAFAKPSEGADPVFDQIFDPFRPDVEGTPVGVAELASVPWLTTGDPCPAGDRPTQIACAVWALGSTIGTITTHEVGHSLGLADPGGPTFHNSGDWPNAIMDSGYARSFQERSELLGQGPGIWCRHNWDYLKQVLPHPDPDPIPDRLECY